jgi:hypothetical protein
MISSGLFAALVLLAALGCGQGSQPPALSSPAKVSAAIAVGDYTASATVPFAVPIVLTEGTDIIAWQFNLHYDASDVRIYTDCDPFAGNPYCNVFSRPVTEGPFFASVSPFNVFLPGIIVLDGVTGDQAGKLLAATGLGGDRPGGPDAPGILAYVLFLAVDGGTGLSPITIGDFSLTRGTEATPTTFARRLPSADAAP